MNVKVELHVTVTRAARRRIERAKRALARGQKVDFDALERAVKRRLLVGAKCPSR